MQSGNIRQGGGQKSLYVTRNEVVQKYLNMVSSLRDMQELESLSIRKDLHKTRMAWGQEYPKKTTFSLSHFWIFFTGHYQKKLPLSNAK